MEELGHARIAARFHGPPTSGNGGYSCGLIAAAIEGAAEVTLESPPPLERTMRLVRPREGEVELFDGDRRIGRARSAALSIEVPAPPAFAEAEEATSRYVGRSRHPYPTCFVCGPDRPSPSGLGLHPGAVAGRSIAAAPWVPSDDLGDAEGLVRAEIVWASLDCPSYFGHVSFEPVEERILLGRLTADVQRRPRVGERAIVIGWSLGRAGRKIRCASALFGEGGELYAKAEAVWICVP
jgi:hypothetical protein